MAIVCKRVEVITGTGTGALAGISTTHPVIAAIVLSARSTQANIGTTQPNFFHSFGAGVSSTQQSCCGSYSEDGRATMRTQSMTRNDSIFAVMTVGSVATVDGRLAISAMNNGAGGNGITFTVSDAFSASFAVEVLLITCDDASVTAACGLAATLAFETGNIDITHNLGSTTGLSFLFFGSGTGSGFNTANDSVMGSLGFATSSSAQRAMGFYSEHAAANVVGKSIMRNDRCLIVPGSSSPLLEISFVSLPNTNTARVNASVNDGGIHPFGWLALRGASVAIGDTTSQAGGVSGLSFKPAGFILGGTFRTTVSQTSQGAHCEYSVGIGNIEGAGVDQTCAWSLETDALADSDNAVRVMTNRMAYHATRTGSNTFTADCELSLASMDSGGWTLTANNADSAANLLYYFAFGPAPAGGATSLVVADSSHQHTSDNVALTQANTLVVPDSSHGHTADSPALAQAGTLAASDSAHAHSSDSPALNQANSLIVAGDAHGHASDSPVLSQANTIIVASSLHSQLSESPALTQSNVLAPADSQHGHESDEIELEVGGGLVVPGDEHAHVVDSPSLTQASVVSVPGDGHAHASDSPTLTQANNLLVNDHQHAHTSDSPTLAEAISLIVQDAAHGHSADSPSLTAAHILAIAKAIHAHLSDSVPLTQAGALAVQDVLHTHLSDSPTLLGLITPLAIFEIETTLGRIMEVESSLGRVFEKETQV